MALFDFLTKKTPEQELTKAQKGLKQLGLDNNYLPDEPFDPSNHEANFGYLNSTITSVDLYEIALYSDVLRNVIPTIRFEIFRNGFDIVGEEIDASLDQKKLIESVLDNANEFGQSLGDVLEEFEDDLQIIDNGYLLAVKDYYYNEDKQVVGAELKQIIRINPLQIVKMMDLKSRLGYNQEGDKIYFNIRDRTALVKDEYNEQGEKNMIAAYRITNQSSSSYTYYDPNEILHVMKYRKSKKYGFSNIYSLYNKTMTLINQDYYMKQYYSGSKVPKGILTVNTSNTTGFKAMWQEFLAKTRKDPTKVYPLINQSEGNTDPIKFVSFMNTLDEMQYTATRNEIRNNIGSLFFVSPIFNNDASTGGGLNNEGLQIAVTDRGIEIGQKIYNSKVFPWIFKNQMGITQFSVELKPSKEIDEIAEKEVRLKELAIARETSSLGIKTTMQKDGSFTFAEGDVKIQDTTQQFQGGGDMDIFDDPEMGIQKSDFQKAVKLPKKVELEVESMLDKELGEILKEFDMKRKPSKANMTKKLDKLMDKLNKRLNKKSSTFIKKIYGDAKKIAEKDIGMSFTLTGVDKNVIETLKRDPTYRKAFTGMTAGLSKNITQIIKDAYKDPSKFTIDNIVKNIRGSLEQSESNLRTIARTETSKISIASRKTQYDKSGFNYVYKWIGPSDNRTGADSTEIKKRTEKGVSWDELVKTIQDVAGPDWKVDPIAPIPRPNTRHTFIAERTSN